MMATVVQQQIPPHFLLVGKKSTLDYIAPALFRIGTLGELVVRAKGSLSIVTAVDVAEMVKRDVPGLYTLSISIGTEEIVIEGMAKRVSYIEIHLSKNRPAPALPVIETPALEAPVVEVPVIEALMIEAAVSEAPIIEVAAPEPAAEIPVAPPKTRSRKKAAAKKTVKRKAARKKASV
jgi:DNA-binding protein Alba